MELVIEDGSIVPGANSWITVEEFVQYAKLRGVTVPQDSLVPAIVEGADYISSLSSQFRGYETQPGVQNLCWPRRGVYVNGQSRPIPDSIIPPGIRKAQLEASLLGLTHDILQNTSEPAVSRSTVGPLSTAYATSSVRPWQGPEFPLLESILEPFLGGRSLWASIPIKRA